jgi:trk system potassium uptake protein TrkA
MKIIILGAGQVGTSVAESLVSEANDITVVDTDVERLQRAAGPARPARGGPATREPAVLRQAAPRTPTC